MASNLTHLPHIRNVQSGINKYDPMHSAMYEVYFTLPEAIQSQFKDDEAVLTEQVTEVTGLDALQKTTAAGTQRFYGVDVSYLNHTLDSTYADITVTFNLNLRNVTDNFVLKIFRAWENLSYDLSDGTRSIKEDYCSAFMKIAEANRNGDVWRSYEFKDVMLTSVTGLDDLDYTANEPRQLQCIFRSDYWYDTLAGGTEQV